MRIIAIILGAILIGMHLAMILLRESPGFIFWLPAFIVVIVSLWYTSKAACGCEYLEVRKKNKEIKGD